MRVNLIYHHHSGEISAQFKLTDPEEAAFSLGIGATPEGARNALTDWINVESDENGKNYRINREKPYVYLFKKKKDGSIVSLNKAINIQEEWPDAPGSAISTRSYEW